MTDNAQSAPAAPPTISPSTGLSVALVVVLLAGAVAWGKQVQRLEQIEIEIKEGRADTRAFRSELASLRDLLIQRTPFQPLSPEPRQTR